MKLEGNKQMGTSESQILFARCLVPLGCITKVSLSKQQLLKHNFHPQDDEFKIEWSKGIIVDEDMELTTSQREMKLVMAVVGPPKCAIFMGQPAWAQNGEF